MFEFFLGGEYNIYFDESNKAYLQLKKRCISVT